MANYIDDHRRHKVPLKDLSFQPAPYIVKALLCKMKADYMRIIYECLDGQNGLLS